MELSRNHFKKFLVDEVMRNSRASAKNAYEEVVMFSRTRKFEETYTKWVSIKTKKTRGMS